MGSFFTLLATLVLVTTLVNAQTPEFIGPLLLQPSINGAKCMTATANKNGASVVLQTCTGSASQNWIFTGGTVRTFGGMCLDVTDGVNQDGTKLQIWGCGPANNPNQQWDYSVWDNTLQWAGKGKCVDVTNGNQADGTVLQVWGCYNLNPNQIWNTGYMPNALPVKSQNGQSGTNQCGTGSDPSSNCQTAWINSATDFCLWAPPTPGTIGEMERVTVAWCTKSGRGARTIPNGTLKGVHFVRTPEYVQVTGTGDFTKMNIPKGDAGGELDNLGADGKGNPIGAVVYGNSFSNGLQYHQWTLFISAVMFCFRACTGPTAESHCNHIYDIMGCAWVRHIPNPCPRTHKMPPRTYDSGTFEDCVGDPALPMGVYGTSTWSQGVKPTPTAHPIPSSSSCTTYPTVTVSPAMVRRGMVHARRDLNGSPDFATMTAAPVA